MPTTSNFGWTTPADTDLVKDGAAAIRTLGNGIDTSLVDLKGGTTGQILSKNSNTDLDYTWINNDQGDITEVQAGTGISVASGTGPVPVVTNTVATTFDAKGDLVVGTGADTFAKLTVGTNGHTLVADSGESTGLKWAAPASGMTLISRTSFTDVASQTFDNVFSSTYQNYLIVIDEIFGVTDGAADLQFQLRYSSSTQAANYYGIAIGNATNAAITTFQSSNANEYTIAGDTGLSNYSSSGVFFLERIGVNSRGPMWHGFFTEMNNVRYFTFYGSQNTYQAYTGFLLKLSNGNVTGTVSIYGLAK